MIDYESLLAGRLRSVSKAFRKYTDQHGIAELLEVVADYLDNKKNFTWIIRPRGDAKND